MSGWTSAIRIEMSILVDKNSEVYRFETGVAAENLSNYNLYFRKLKYLVFLVLGPKGNAAVLRYDKCPRLPKL